MKSKILVGTEVFDITHISTKYGNPNQLHVAEFTMLSVSNVDNERSRVVVTDSFIWKFSQGFR